MLAHVYFGPGQAEWRNHPDPIIPDDISPETFGTTALIAHRLKLSDAEKGYKIFKNAAETDALKVVLSA
ncbi:hypothetical protein AB0N33_20230 [Pseudarthrobacter oxydans]|uniref:hypothetical protein n=1 Tax=Pseudarthrobacter oxydans TaxID=1671 RepID=UPI00342525D9